MRKQNRLDPLRAAAGIFGWSLVMGLLYVLVAIVSYFC